jgi:integrase
MVTGEISDIKSTALEFAWWMKKQGYKQQTIDGRKSILKTLLNRTVDLGNPESVKEYLASVDVSEGRKENIVHAYSCYLRMVGANWIPPRYKRIPKIPYVPHEKHIDSMIAALPGKYPSFLRMLKETGMRPGEAWNLLWFDVDFATKRVRVTPEKGSNPRILPISNTLISMLKCLPRDSEYIFWKGMYKHFSEGFRRHRKKIAFKLGEPDILRITFKSLRHFKGTMEYQKTKDILHVKRILGHKNINNTLIYTHLIDFGEDEWISKVARNAEEVCEIVEAGFEFVCSTPDDFMVFRKRK